MTDTREDRPSYEIWVVDRIEGPIAVLVEDEGEIIVEVTAQELGEHAVEGAILMVPLGSVGEPVWAEAERSDAEEVERREDAEARLERLRQRDPGGDIEL